MRKEWWYVVVIAVLVLGTLVFSSSINSTGYSVSDWFGSLFQSKENSLTNSPSEDVNGFDSFISQFPGEENARAREIIVQLKEIVAKSEEVAT